MSASNEGPPLESLFAAAPPSESTNTNSSVRREEFRNYLDKTGVITTLTRILVGLYETQQKPENPIDYFLDQLSKGTSTRIQLDNLKIENERIEKELKEVMEENEILRKRFATETTTVMASSEINDPETDHAQVNENTENPNA